MGTGVAHRDADEPIRHKGNIGNDFYVFIAAQNPLYRRAGRVKKSEDDSKQEKMANGLERDGIVGKNMGNRVEKQIRRRNRKDDNHKDRQLREHGVLPGADKIFGADFVADDDGRRQADAPRYRIGERGVADGGLIGSQIDGAKFSHQ